MLDAGVDLGVVAKILGHKDTKTTYRWYLQLKNTKSFDKVREAMRGEGRKSTKSGNTDQGEISESEILKSVGDDGPVN